MLIKKFKWELSLVLILILEIIIFGVINPRFLQLNVLLFSINDFVVIAIIALFVTYVVITGGIDISIGSIVGLVSTVIGITWKLGGINIWMTIPIAILVGAICGLLNGFLIGYTGVQAMVVTLGSMILFSGLSLVIIGISGSSAYEGISGMPQSFINISNGNILGIPNLLILFAILFVISYILLNKTKYGRYIFLIGINRNAAKYSGINTKLITMSTYIFSGISAAIAGIIITSYLGSSRPDLGSESTMPIITAVVLGGTAMTGGKGGVIGTALASIVVGIMRFGLQMANLSSQYISIATGILLITAVALNNISSNFKFGDKNDAISQAVK